MGENGIFGIVVLCLIVVTLVLIPGCIARKKLDKTNSINNTSSTNKTTSKTDESNNNTDKECFNLGIMGDFSDDLGYSIANRYNTSLEPYKDNENDINYYEFDVVKRHYSLVAFPDGFNKFYGVFSTLRSMDGIVINIKINNDEIPYIEDKCYLAKIIGIKPIVFNIMHSNSDMDYTECKNKLTTLAIKCGISKSDFIIIDTKVTSNDEKVHIDEESIDSFVKQCEIHVQKKSADYNAQFFMAIDDVFNITGRGTVATGLVSSGTLHKNDEIELLGYGTKEKISVKNIEGFGTTYDTAYAGYQIGVNFDNKNKINIERGMVLSKQGVLKLQKEFCSELYVLEKSSTKSIEELKSGCNYTIFANTIKAYSTIKMDKETLKGGKSGEVTLVFSSPMAIPSNTAVVVCDENGVIALGFIK